MCAFKWTDDGRNFVLIDEFFIGFESASWGGFCIFSHGFKKLTVDSPSGVDLFYGKVESMNVGFGLDRFNSRFCDHEPDFNGFILGDSN